MKIEKTYWSWMGFGFAGLYCLAIGICVFEACLSNTDKSGHFIFLQLPIALQGAALVALGLGPLLEKLNWPSAYLFIGTPTLILLYIVGWVIDRWRVRRSH